MPDYQGILSLPDMECPEGVSFNCGSQASGKRMQITGVTLPQSGGAVSCVLMAFMVPPMCREQLALRALGTALDRVEMAQEVCQSAPEALDLTMAKQYSALVLDFDLPGAATVARMGSTGAFPTQARYLREMIGVFTKIAEYPFRPASTLLFTNHWTSTRIVRLPAGRARLHASRPETIATPAVGIAGLSAVRHCRASGHGAGSEPERNGVAGAGTVATGAAGAYALRFARHPNMVEGMGEVVWADDAGRAGMLFSRSLTPRLRGNI